MKRNSFVFYASYKEAIDNLPNEQKLNLFNAICDYALNSKITKLKTKTEKSLFNLIIPTLDSSIKRYEANAKNGKKGGAPKGNQNALKQPPTAEEKTTQIQPKNNPNSTQQTSEKQPKNNLNYNYNVNYNENYNNNSYQNNSKEIKVDNKKTIENELNCNDKKNYFYEILIDKLKKFLDNSIIDIALYNRILNLFNAINSNSSFTIKGKTLAVELIFESYLSLFMAEDNKVATNFIEIFNKIDSTQNINDKLKYSVSTFYKASQNLSV